MPYLAVLQKVQDYDVWKKVFDAHAPQRRAAGESNYQIFHVDGDRNNFSVLIEWDSLANAKAWIESDTLRNAMEQAGVRGKPTVMLMNAGESGKP